MLLKPQDLVNARLYPNEDAVIQDALRSLLQEKPHLRIELAIYRYQTEEISLAKAAHLAGMSYDRMKELMHQRGIQLQLGPVDDAEIQEEIDTLRMVLGQQKKP